ncbi:hypothetical protein NEMBOFW57_010636 [Staphylotrichum longicolle]|uniref:Heterokaryon incompatibility domain-containing protein n=1 Tax=Staphylotrichum longicolle TaxID=669026 RepID=A0AAD4ERU9_9PEZI|nr:hypothetical protein NEMBOFW57_010636 [Staphylotrichum longicolle]
MWLINCSNYQLEPNDLGSSQSKPYWILSHTWGEDEVNFQDMQSLALSTAKLGFQKIQSMCKLALTSGINYVWIDKCCIDKTSSAELSESINSMFYWYKESERCIAFLNDLAPGAESTTENELRGCRWFTRGWTLQELLAPSNVDFYDGQWNLSNITGIRNDILAHPSGTNGDILHTVSVATRMSWPAARQPTRIEDKAYCLLGIFDVHMPLLYGERGQAFIRLQQAIAQRENDMSLFAWIALRDNKRLPLSTYSGLLASDPSQFAIPAEIVTIRDALLPAPSWIITNAGIEMTTALDQSTGFEHTIMTRRSNGTVRIRTVDVRPKSYYRLLLHCRMKDPADAEPSGELPCLAIWLRKTSSGYVRYHSTELCLTKWSAMKFNDPRYISVPLSLTKQHQHDALESLSFLQDKNILPNTLYIERNFSTCDAQVEFKTLSSTFVGRRSAQLSALA